MIELLRQAAPSATALVTDTHEVTYAELVAMAEAAAGWLRDHDVERFAIDSVEGDVVTALLAAASLAGAEACVYPPESESALHDLRGRFEHSLIVSDRTAFTDALAPAALFTHEAPIGNGPPDFRPHLVLTTGTTGAPRGVRHLWPRLLARSRDVSPARGQRWMLCFGLHQFAGLQVMTHVAAAGATLVAWSPRRPQRGLAAMRSQHVTHASATPTYWRFLLAEARADRGPLPRLDQITLGGEAAGANLLADIERTFPSAAVSHIYAASEFGSAGSVRDGQFGIPEGTLDRGGAGVALKVVDGELWVRSREGMVGYWGEPDVDPDEWRPTGDLVEVIDGRVTFLGRTSEIINVGGVKVHPLPIEERVAGIDGIGSARVFGRPNSLVGNIVAVEAVLTPTADADAVRDAIRAACADLPSAAWPRSIKFVDILPTLGGKTLRRQPS